MLTQKEKKYRQSKKNHGVQKKKSSSCPQKQNKK